MSRHTYASPRICGLGSLPNADGRAAPLARLELHQVGLELATGCGRPRRVPDGSRCFGYVGPEAGELSGPGSGEAFRTMALVVRKLWSLRDRGWRPIDTKTRRGKSIRSCVETRM